LGQMRSYCLKLADGQGWQIIVAGEDILWVEKLASIMELKACESNGYLKMIFFKNKSVKEDDGYPLNMFDDKILEDFPKSGWKVHNFGGLQLWDHHEVRDLIYEIGPEENSELNIINVRVALHPIYQRTQDSGGLPIHAALVEWRGMGILLGAPGRTGKSTCCRIIPPPWHTLCDDETLIVKDSSKLYKAHPFPTWSDYFRRRSRRTWNVQQHVPLSAIFFLEQSVKDELFLIGQGEAAAYINQLATHVIDLTCDYLDREEGRSLKKGLFYNACELTKAVPSYILRVSLNGRFWKKIEEVLH
jgi:SynChlorMet cassette protein ScmC